jgi:hypothetical protein
VLETTGKRPEEITCDTFDESSSETGEVAGDEGTNTISKQDGNEASLSTMPIEQDVCYQTGLLHSTADSGTYDYKYFAKGQRLYGTSCIHATCKRYFVDKLINFEDVNEVRPKDGIYNHKKRSRCALFLVTVVWPSSSVNCVPTHQALKQQQVMKEIQVIIDRRDGEESENRISLFSIIVHSKLSKAYISYTTKYISYSKAARIFCHDSYTTLHGNF